MRLTYMRKRMDLIVNSSNKDNKLLLRIILLLLNSADLNFNDIDNETLKQISALSQRNQDRFKALINNLQDMGLLSVETLKMALARVTISIPKVAESPLVKIKNVRRNEHQLGHTSFFLNRGASRSEDASGGQASINMGYASASANEPSVSVKRMNKSRKDYAQPVKSLAAREARYLNFLGRQGAWYTSKKGPIIVGQWQQGSEVIENMKMNEDYYFGFSDAQRLQWLASGFEELDRLHANFRLHGDLKAQNFVLDEAANKLRMIDFATVQKVNSGKKFAVTPLFTDMKEGNPRKTGSDMFSMGYLVAVMFPELFKLAVTKEKERIMSPRGEVQLMRSIIPPYLVKKIGNPALSATEKAVIALLDALMEPNTEDRCTSQQALQFCNSLAAMLSVKTDIEEQDLATLLTSSINRNVYEVEDAMRGSKRPAKI